jgi:hypothetical protein
MGRISFLKFKIVDKGLAENVQDRIIGSPKSKNLSAKNKKAFQIS